LKAGADILFIESPESEEEMARIGRTFDVPLLANMVEGGRTPVLDKNELERLGFKIAIFPTSGLLAAGAAMRSVYQEIRSAGSSKSWTGNMYAFNEFCRLMGFERVWQFEREHAET
jgi:2,3-dimethylmalate lyase